MNIEGRVLNLFLHQKREGSEFRVGMAYNYTSEPVSSWRESLLHGGDSSSGNVYLGAYLVAEVISTFIRKKVEEMHHPFPIAAIHLHNEGDYEGGEKDKIPEQTYGLIHSCLNSKPLRVYQEHKSYCW